jgi:hypothetical protein
MMDEGVTSTMNLIKMRKIAQIINLTLSLESNWLQWQDKSRRLEINPSAVDDQGLLRGSPYK